MIRHAKVLVSCLAIGIGPASLAGQQVVVQSPTSGSATGTTSGAAPTKSQPSTTPTLTTNAARITTPLRGTLSQLPLICTPSNTVAPKSGGSTTKSDDWTTQDRVVRQTTAGGTNTSQTANCVPAKPKQSGTTSKDSWLTTTP